MIRIRQVLIYCLLLCSINVYSQPDTNVLFGSRDTVFVYDTLFVVDTIRILRTTKELEDLEKLSPLKISYLDNSSTKKKISLYTATLSHPRINSLNNFNLKNEEMKKLGLLGLMFFAFQNMVLAQHNVGVYVGSGVHNLTDNYQQILGNPSGNTLIRPTLQLGVSYRKLIMKEKLFFDVGLAFSKLKPSRVPVIQKHFDNGTISESGIFTVRETDLFPNQVPFVITRNYNVVSIPMTFSLNSKFFQPTIGAEICYKHVSSVSKAKDIEPESLFSYGGYHFRSIGAAALLGFRLPIKKRFNFSVIYVRQLLESYPFEDEYVASVLGGQMQRLDITVRYQLLRNNINTRNKTSK